MTDFLNVWLPLIVAALIQSSFALGVSMLALLTGRVLAKSESAHNLRKLSFFYVFGSFATTFVLITSTIYILLQIPIIWYGDRVIFAGAQDYRVWRTLVSIVIGVGIVILLFYYRRGKKNGTRLQLLPRNAAEYLYERTRVTKQSFEAFILGIASIVFELVYIFAPIVIAANLILNLASAQQILAIFIYTIISIVPLVILRINNRRGGKISAFQKWREKNKKFLQIAAGVLSIVLGIYLFVYKVLGGY